MGRRQRTARARALALATARQEPQRQEWYRIDNRAGSREAQVHLYDEIGYWGTSASDFVADINELDVDTITLYINSPGGEVYDGITIYNALRRHKATVNVIVDGLAASAASFIAQAGDTRTMSRNATMMIHDASTIVWGDAAELTRVVEQLEKCSANIADIYAQRCGKDAGYWRDLMRAETWFDATEAVEFGLADAVEGSDSTEEASEPAQALWNLSIYRYAKRSDAPAPGTVVADPVDNLVTPVDEPVQAVEDYDPGQRRDDEGRWSDGMPGDIVSTTLTAGGRDLGMSRKGNGTVALTIGDTTVDLTADEADEVTGWPWDARDLEDGDLLMLQRDSYVPAALIRDTDDTWRFGVSTAANPLANAVTLTGADLDQLGNKFVQLEGAHRVNTGAGRVDMYVTDDHRAGLRLRDEDRNVVEVLLRPSEFDKVSRAVSDLAERADSRQSDTGDDDDYDDEAPADDAADDVVDVLTSVGVVRVRLDGKAVTLGPVDGPWTVRLADGEEQQAFTDAAARTVDVLDRLVDVWNAAVWAMTRERKTTPVKAERLAEDWAALTAHLTSGSSTVEDPLARLREAL